MMTLKHAIHLFEVLSEDDKAKILGTVSHDLTIAGRDVCTEGDCEQQRKKLADINEIQHNALGQMLAYLERRQGRYSDESIFLILVERAKSSGILGYLQNALEEALSPFDHASK